MNDESINRWINQSKNERWINQSMNERWINRSMDWSITSINQGNQPTHWWTERAIRTHTDLDSSFDRNGRFIRVDFKPYWNPNPNPDHLGNFWDWRLNYRFMFSKLDTSRSPFTPLIIWSFKPTNNANHHKTGQLHLQVMRCRCSYVERYSSTLSCCSFFSSLWTEWRTKATRTNA